MTKKKINTLGVDETLDLGKKIGARLQGGEVIVLASDLGGGKTTLAKGLVEGMGSNDLVSSPTFTISNIYETPKVQIHHYDFYRLDHPGIMAEDLKEVLSSPNNVIIIEWAQTIKDILPVDIVEISITVSGDYERLFSIYYTDKLFYLMEDIK